MKYASPLTLVTLALWGCSERAGPHPPTSPTAIEPRTAPALPTPSVPAAAVPAGFLIGYVVDDATRQLCIPGAWVEVVSGQAAGRRAEQVTPCSIWGYDGGFILRGLTPGEATTIRVSAPGHVTRDTTLLPTLGWQSAVEVVLAAVPR